VGSVRRHGRGMTEPPVALTEGLTKEYGRRVAVTDLDLEIMGEPALYDRLTGREHAQYLGFLRGNVTPERVESCLHG